MDAILFDGWSPVLRTLLLGLLAYVALIVLLRVSGPRTLSKMNAFDFVVTIALGSTLATILLGKGIALAQGVAAFSLLIGLQFGVTWLSVRFPSWRRMVTGEPRLLYYEGDFITAAMRSSRVTEGDVLAAIRNAGHANRDRIRAVVLETDASLSVIVDESTGQGAALADVQGVREQRRAAMPRPPA